MLIHYDRPNVLNFPKLGANGQPDYVRFVPGVNEVDSDVWAQMQKDPTIKRMLEDGVLKEKSKSETFKKLPAQGAEKVIAQTYDIGLLTKWKAEETRRPVISAIDKQLAMVEAKTKVVKKDKNSDEDDEE